jgi:hypothetical protein
MANRMIVMVSDLDDASHGEINILESPEQAARLVEQLIESGFDQERVRVFGGDEMEMQVHHRPVVSLTSPGGKPKKDNNADNADEEEEVPATAEAPEAEGELERVNSVANSLQVEEVAASTPFERNGVRFSSQFRPA